MRPKLKHFAIDGAINDHDNKCVSELFALGVQSAEISADVQRYGNIRDLRRSSDYKQDDYSYSNTYSGINSYGASVQFNRALAPDDNFCIGIESELSFRSDELKDIYRDSDTKISTSNWVYTKRDGSLGSLGAEFVSIPIGEKMCLQPRFWDEYLNFLRTISYSLPDTRCGLHMHTSPYFLMTKEDRKRPMDEQKIIRFHKTNALALLYTILRKRYHDCTTILFGRDAGSYREEVKMSPTLKRKLIYADIFSAAKDSNTADKLCKLQKEVEELNSGSKFLSDFSSDNQGQETTSTLGPVSLSISCGQGDDTVRIVLPSGKLELSNVTRDVLSIKDRKPDNSTLGLFLNASHGDELNIHVGDSRLSKTIEFRLGKGTLDTEALYSVVVFIYCLVCFVRDNDVDTYTLADNVLAFTRMLREQPYSKRLSDIFTLYTDDNHTKEVKQRDGDIPKTKELTEVELLAEQARYIRNEARAMELDNLVYKFATT